jgi:hypothetical protein
MRSDPGIRRYFCSHFLIHCSRRVFLANLMRHGATKHHLSSRVITVTDMDDDADVELAHQPGVRFLHLTSRRINVPEMVR